MSSQHGQGWGRLEAQGGQAGPLGVLEAMQLGGAWAGPWAGRWGPARCAH